VSRASLYRDPGIRDLINRIRSAPSGIAVKVNGAGLAARASPGDMPAETG